MVEQLIEKAIAKATGSSLSDALNGLPTALTFDQAKEAVQWAIDTHTDSILCSMREILEEMSAHPKDQKHTYGFELAVNLVNDNFTE